jgi:hypothetical protein
MALRIPSLTVERDGPVVTIVHGPLIVTHTFANEDLAALCVAGLTRTFAAGGDPDRVILAFLRAAGAVERAVAP